MDDTWWVRQNQLDDDQKDVFSLSIHKDHFVKGPPGSGKTNLLLLRAKQLIGSNYPNVIVVVHTRTLQEFIRSGAPQYGVPSSKITTFRKLGIDILYQCGVTINLPFDFDSARKMLAETLLLKVNSNNLKKSYSCVLIDEAQDFIPQEIEILCNLGIRFFAVADYRQKIYRGQDSISIIESKANVITLCFHYRNGQKICVVADGLSKFSGDGLTLQGASKYDERKLESSVNVISTRTIGEQCLELTSRLETQLKAYPHELIGVVCPRGEDLSEVIKYLKQSSLSRNIIIQTSENGYMQFEQRKSICVSKLHSAKGLEFRAFHILAAEGLKKFPMQRELTFMGVTRAKTSLCIYHSDSLPGYLEGALSGLQPPKPVIGLNDLLFNDNYDE